MNRHSPANGLSVLLLAALLPARAATPAMRPVVLELFTSQGCSSCPPADALLGQVAGRPDVIALAFHVDYWDYLGWRDAFELPQSAPRQQRYANALSRAGSFTPQLVIDGAQSVVGSDARALRSALATPRSGVPVQLSLDDQAVSISVAARAAVPSEVVAVSYLARATTRVGRGENGGSTLTEFNIVRSVHPLGLLDGQMQRFTLPRSALPRDATGVAVLVQGVNQGAVQGAAAIALR